MGEQIGFIGLGSMGLPMAQNLIEAGYSLTVYNRTAAKAEPLMSRGAKLAKTPGDTALPGGVVITIVADDASLHEVVRGERDLAQRLAPAGIHISMSTILPATSRELSRHHEEQGSLYLAAPVFGRPDAAALRKLWVVASGPAAARARVEPILKVLGQGIFDFGEEPGAANVVKLAGNFLIIAALEAMGEAFVMAEKNGVAPLKLAEMLTSTMFACTVYQGYGRRLALKEFLPAGFRMPLGLKDTELVLRTAADAKTPMPLASLAYNRFISAIANGREEMDWSAMAIGAAQDAGLELKK